MRLTYAGIGSRQTPPQVLADMKTIAAWLARCGWHLHSGGAQGADTAFASGAPIDQRTQFLPWPRFQDLAGPDCITLNSGQMARCQTHASYVHPAWHRCSLYARKLHARNVAIMSGPTTRTPVAAVVCWTPGGAISGGTGMGIRIAHQLSIPVLNLATITPRDACLHLREIRRTSRTPDPT